MATIDLRKCLNAISDVVNNRPPPLRQFDQIYMKTADMLLHTDHVGKCFDGKSVVFVGDGDAIGLCLVHLHKRKLLPYGPRRVHILDFDGRMVESVREFAKKYKISRQVSATLYNVADPLPHDYFGKFDAFHINPPFGKVNGGTSIFAFMNRAFEATTQNSIGCVVLADDERQPWTSKVLQRTQFHALKSGWWVSELLPRFHSYHLDDVPDLTSCTLVIRRNDKSASKNSTSRTLPVNERKNFYGKDKPLNIRYLIPDSSRQYGYKTEIYA